MRLPPSITPSPLSPSSATTGISGIVGITEISCASDDVSLKASVHYWGEEFFNLLYWRLFMKRSAQCCMHQASGILSIAQSEIDFKNFNTKSKIEILDTCSGISDVAQALSHTLKLKDIPHHIDTVEMTRAYVDVALDQGLKSVSPYCDDVFKFLSLTSKNYDLITNWYSSFGYFEPHQNARFLELCISKLKSGGVFILECSNSIKVKKDFAPLFSYEQIDPLTLKSYLIERVSTIEMLNNGKELLSTKPFAKLYQKWTYKDRLSPVSTSYDTHSFMYEAPSIINILRNFCPELKINLYSSDDSGSIDSQSVFSLQKYNEEHKRLIIVCKKTASDLSQNAHSTNFTA